MNIHSRKFKSGVLASAVLSFLVFVPYISSGAFGSLSSQVSDPSVQTVNLSSAISNGVAMRYNVSGNFAWVSELGNSIASINLNTVLSQGAAAVKSYTGLFPSSAPGVGNLVSGGIGLTLLNGLVYTDAMYNFGIAVASLNPANGAGSVYYTTIAGSASAMLGRGTNVYIASGTKLVIFDTTTHNFASFPTGVASLNDLVAVGNTIYFAYTNTSSAGGGGIGQINADGSSLIFHDAKEAAINLALDSTGNIWFTGSNDLAEWDGSAFHHFGFEGGSVQSGPIGLVNTPGGLWVWGNAYHVVRFFAFSTLAYASSSDISTASLRPWAGIVDTNGNVWGFALDGFILIEISSALTSTMTATSTVTSTTTATPTSMTTVTKTTTSTSSITQTVTTTVTSTTATYTTTVTSTTTVTTTPHQTCDRGHGDQNGDNHGHGDQNGKGNGDDCGGGDD